MEKQYYVYILASQRYGTLYVGVTSNLIRRIHEHKNNKVDGFTQKYNCKLLVYFEVTGDVHTALEREKQIKNWKRSWKIELIEKENPSWSDLYKSII